MGLGLGLGMSLCLDHTWIWNRVLRSPSNQDSIAVLDDKKLGIVCDSDTWSGGKMTDIQKICPLFNLNLVNINVKLYLQ